MLKKIIVGLLIFSFVFLPTAQAATEEELVAQIQSLLALIASLQAQLNAQGASGVVAPAIPVPAAETGVGTVSSGFCYTFKNNLKIGNVGPGVKALAEVLYREGLLEQNRITNLYNEEIASAVSDFQERYSDEVLAPAGLTQGNGYLGAGTRAKVNALYGCGTVTTGIQFPIKIHNSDGSLDTTIRLSVFSPSGTPLALYSTRFPDLPIGYGYRATLSVVGNGSATEAISASFDVTDSGYRIYNIADDGRIEENLELLISRSGNETKIVIYENEQASVYYLGLATRSGAAVSILSNLGSLYYGVGLGEYILKVEELVNGVREYESSIMIAVDSNGVAIKEIPSTPVVPVGAAANVSSPFLGLSYDSASKESALTASFSVLVTAGSQDVSLFNGSFGVSLENEKGQQGFTNGSSSEVSSNLPMQMLRQGVTGWIVKAGQTGIFTVKRTAVPREMFSGTYTAKVTAIHTLDSSQIAPAGNTKTNGVTIVGEVSPYITSVVPEGDRVSIKGVRFNSGKNTVNVGGKEFGVDNYALSTSGGYVIEFSASAQGIVAGNYPIYIVNPVLGTRAGKSNVFWGKIGGTVDQKEGSAVITGSPVLTLSYDSSSKEESLTAQFNVAVTAGSRDLTFNRDFANINFYNQEGKAVYTNSRTSYTSSLSGSMLVKAGQTGNFIASATAKPREMFAGTYYARLENMQGTPVSPAANSTNIKTIVGEVSPYITSVVSEGDRVKVKGVRFNSGRNTINVGGSEFTTDNYSLSTAGEYVIEFSASAQGISPNSYPLYVTNPVLGTVAGKSNVYWTKIEGGISTQALSGSLLNSFEDRAGAWDVFRPGPGNGNSNRYDWNWNLSLKLPPPGKGIKSISIKHNNGYEAWSTSKDNIYGKAPYPLVVYVDGGTNPLNYTYGDLSLFQAGESTQGYKLYGQVETEQFSGATLEVKFTDSTIATAAIPASSYRPSSAAQTAMSCDAIKVTQKYYADLCRTEGYDNACFNKFSGAYQGCTRNTNNDCTVNNTNATQNILCPVSTAVSPSITVLSPNGGETYSAGQTINIGWNSPGLSLSEYLRISLQYSHNDNSYPGGKIVEDWIVERTPNTGSYAWRIPEYYAYGLNRSDFAVRVHTASGSVNDYSNQKFTILPGVLTNNVTVTKPVGGTYYAGQQLPIEWIRSGEPYSVRLLQKSNPTFTRWISDSWVIPTDLPSAPDYYIAITEGPNRSRTGYSASFGVSAPVSKPQVCGTRGDMNLDGRLSSADVDLLRNHVVGLTSLDIYRQADADLNNDGGISTGDITYLNSYLAGTISTFPVCLASTALPSITEFRTSHYLTESIRSTTLVWNATNATSCLLNGPNFPPNAPYGTNEAISTGTLTADATYKLTCVNSRGSVSQSITVPVPSIPSAAGELIVQTHPETPSFTTVFGGTANVVIGRVRFSASVTEGIRLERVGLNLTSGSPSDVVKVTLWDGSAQIGEAYFAGTNSTTATLTTQPLIERASSKTITIKADLAKIGPADPGRDGAVVKIDAVGATSYGTGQSSGSRITASGSSAVYGVQMMAQTSSTNQSPAIKTLTGPSSTVLVNQGAVWKLNVYDPDGTAMTVSATWGDGNSTSVNVVAGGFNTSTEATLGNVYSSAGTYLVTFTVRDANGATASQQTSVTVSAATTPPPPTTPTLNLTSAALASGVLQGTLELKFTNTDSSGTCFHLVKESTGTITGGVSVCDRGTNLTISVSGSSVSAGDRVKLCHGNNYSLCTNTVSITAPTAVTPAPDSLTFSVLSSTDDRSSGYGFAPGNGADWNFSATLSLGAAKTIRDMRISAGTETWSTQSSGYYNLVVFQDGVQLNTAYGQAIPAGPGTDTYTLYAQKWLQEFNTGYKLTITFDDASAISATVSNSPSASRQSISQQLASALEAAKAILREISAQNR